MTNTRLKEIFGTDDIVELFSRLNAYEFEYKPEALKLYGEDRGVDQGTNYGIMAQELEQNPLTENTVIEDENGFKNVQTDKLAAVDAAVLSDVCKRLLALEERVAELSKE